MTLETEEIWRVVPDWPQYEVSNLGNVRSLIDSRRRRRAIPRPRKLVTTTSGYPAVMLNDAKRRKVVFVHRMVACAFIGPQPPNHEIAHLDGSRTNNAASNLIWATRKENLSHRRLHGTHPSGSKHGQAKLCDRAVAAIRLIHKEHKWTHQKLATVFQMSTTAIGKILSGDTWRDTSPLAITILQDGVPRP